MMISELDFVGDQTAIKLRDELGVRTTSDLDGIDMATLYSIEGIGVQTAHRLLDAADRTEAPA